MQATTEEAEARHQQLVALVCALVDVFKQFQRDPNFTTPPPPPPHQPPRHEEELKLADLPSFDGDLDPESYLWGRRANRFVDYKRLE